MFKMATIVYKFLSSSHPSHFSPFLILLAAITIQEEGDQKEGSWKFLNFVHSCTNSRISVVMVLVLLLL